MGAGLEKTIVLADESATLSLGAAWAAILRPENPPWIIFLKGDLGAGKTTFVRGFLRGMGYKDNVKSPTYTLVESYPFDIFDLSVRRTRLRAVNFVDVVVEGTEPAAVRANGGAGETLPRNGFGERPRPAAE